MARGPFVGAAELLRGQPDLIVAAGPEVALQAVVGASGHIPIVMFAVNFDPIERGYVTSLAQPGGNITGVPQSAGHIVRRANGRSIRRGQSIRKVAKSPSPGAEA